MNLKSVLSLFLITSPLIYAESDACSNIDSEIQKRIRRCIVNEEGHITSLSIESDITDEETSFNSLFPDLTELNYNIQYTNENSELPSSIIDLKNLEYLSIDYDVSINPCSTTCRSIVVSQFSSEKIRNMKNLKYLTLHGINVSQENIDDISTLSNLETLNFYESYLDDSINYEPIGNLEKLRQMDIVNPLFSYIKRTSEDNGDPDYYYSPNVETMNYNTPKELINANKYIKELNLYIYENKDKTIEGLPTSIEILDVDPNSNVDLSYIENMNNLTYLCINNHPYEALGPRNSQYPEFSLKLSKLNKLNELVIKRRDITDEMIDEILNIQNIQNLTITRCHASEEGLEKLKNSDRIASIDITKENIMGIDFDNVKATFKSNSSETSTNTSETNSNETTISEIPREIETIIEIEPTTTTTTQSTILKTLTKIIMPTEDSDFYDDSDYYDSECETYIQDDSDIENGGIETDDEIYDYDVKISLDGRCGKDFGVCREGYCCSKWGWCGNTDFHCNAEKGCNSKFGTCNTVDTTVDQNGDTNGNKDIETEIQENAKVSLDGRCGEEFGVCREGYCCSKWGWCGNTDFHCSIDNGCNSKFGACNTVDTSVDQYGDANENNNIETETQENIIKISLDGKCGEGLGVCREGYCCSKWGWCGKSDIHCNVKEGCNPQYGICYNANTF